MRVLYISNLGSVRCGVKEYGEIWAREMRKVGVQVDEWDGTYSACASRGYLPLTVDDPPRLYDLIHLNWDPQTINHYLPEHFPKDTPLSVFLHDSPDTSTCPLYQRADLLMGYVGGEWGGRKVVQVDHAVPPAYTPPLTFRGVPIEFPPYSTSVVVGITGIRDDPGHQMVRDLCEERGWIFSPPTWWLGDIWASTDYEIRRLAESTFNVCWYHTTGRGKSMAAMFAAAARRPLLLSNSSMFSVLEPYRSKEVYMTATPPDARSLEVWCDMILRHLQRRALVPDKLLEDLSWERCARKIKELWEGAARG